MDLLNILVQILVYIMDFDNHLLEYGIGLMALFLGPFLRKCEVEKGTIYLVQGVIYTAWGLVNFLLWCQ